MSRFSEVELDLGLDLGRGLVSSGDVGPSTFASQSIALSQLCRSPWPLAGAYVPGSHPRGREGRQGWPQKNSENFDLDSDLVCNQNLHLTKF